MARFSHIAGDVALDLINTVEWRLSLISVRVGTVGLQVRVTGGLSPN